MVIVDVDIGKSMLSSMSSYVLPEDDDDDDDHDDDHDEHDNNCNDGDNYYGLHHD